MIGFSSFEVGDNDKQRVRSRKHDFTSFYEFTTCLFGLLSLFILGEMENFGVFRLTEF